ncbi:MAG TPA: hypothetical protein EYQ10_01120 [Gammaproteobacteria bacterium]|jgi:hypothetical protein|nr:hypothetical protein [Gammaproteobacteria bacterium]
MASEKACLAVMNISDPTIYLDMDGVLADFFGAFAKYAGVEHWKHIDQQKLQDVLDKITGSDYFAKLPKTKTCDNIIEMAIDFAGSYSILSSPLRGDISNSSKHKQTWVTNNLSPQPRETIIVRDKTLYAAANGVQNILIDDRGSNIYKWQQAGGYGIKYQADEDNLSVISGALKAYERE